MGHVQCLVKVYAVVVSPSRYNVRWAATQDGRPSKYHRTKGLYLHRVVHDVAWRSVG